MLHCYKADESLLWFRVGEQLKVHPLRLFDACNVKIVHNYDMRVDMGIAPDLCIFCAAARRKQLVGKIRLGPRKGSGVIRLVSEQAVQVHMR